MANGPLQKIPPLAQTSGYATDCGGRDFSTRPGAALPHVGSLVPCNPCCHTRWIHLATGFGSQRQKISKTPWPKNLGLHWPFLIWYFTTCLQKAVKRQTGECSDWLAYTMLCNDAKVRAVQLGFTDLCLFAMYHWFWFDKCILKCNISFKF